MLESNCFQNFLSKSSFREIIFGLTNIRCLFIRVIYLWSTVLFLLWHLSAKSSQHSYICLISIQRCHHAQIESNYSVVFEDSWIHQFSSDWSWRKNWWKIFSSSLNTRWKKNLSSSCLQTASVLGKNQCFPSSLTMISNATFKPNHFLLPQTSRNSQRHPDRAGRKTGPTFLPSAALVGVSTAPSPATFTMAAGRSML